MKHVLMFDDRPYFAKAILHELELGLIKRFGLICWAHHAPHGYRRERGYFTLSATGACGRHLPVIRQTVLALPSHSKAMLRQTPQPKAATPPYPYPSTVSYQLPVDRK